MTIDAEPAAIIVRRTGAAVHAWLNICPHQGRRLDYLPGRFLLDRGLLVCAAHGASFALPEGRCVSGPCLGERLRAVPLVAIDADTFAVDASAARGARRAF